MKGKKLSEATVTNEVTEEPKVQTFTDELQELQFKSLNQMIVERNAIVGQVNAANGDRQTLTEQIRENSQDPAIVEAREELSKWVLRLDELVKPIVDKQINDSAGSVKELEEKIQKADQALKPGLTYYKKMYGDEAAEFFEKQARLQGTQVRSGSGGRRIRGFNVIVTIDGESNEFENFSNAAKHIGVDTGDLQAGFFSKAGTDDTKKLPDEVSYVINFEETDKDGNKEKKDAFVKAYRDEASKASNNAANAGETASEPEPETDASDSSEDYDLPDEDDLENQL